MSACTPPISPLSADAKANCTTFADIYKLDPAVAAALLGKQTKPEAVADNAEAKVEPKPKPKPKPSTVGSAAPPQASGFTAAIP